MRFPLQLLVTLALLTTLAGLAWRERAHMSYAFLWYAWAIITCGGLVALWPDRFHTPQFWAVKQTVYDVAKLAVALELAWRVVRAFPGAQRTAQRGAVALLLVFTSLAVAFPPSGGGMMGDGHTRLMAATVWLLGLSALVAMWYRLPLHSWHRALLLGFSAYLMVFTVLLKILWDHGWPWAAVLGRLDGLAYLALCCGWAVEAWRVERVPEIEPALKRRLGMGAA